MKERIRLVLDACRRLSTTPPLSPEAIEWMAWCATYLVWHESAQLRTAVQWRGPARGIVQLEPETVWDTLNLYVFQPRRRPLDAVDDERVGGGSVKPVDTRLEFLLTGVPDPARRAAVAEALRSFRRQARPGIHWTGGEEVAAELVANDEFALLFMVLHLRRFRAVYPPLSGAYAAAPQGASAHGEHLFFWLKRWWKGRARDEAERARAFLASAVALDEAWAGSGTVPTLQPAGAAWVERFPTSTSLTDLAGGTDESGFRRRFEKFHAMLTARLPTGSDLAIAATLRPRERAYLMHWSFRIARENLEPIAVPPMAGVGIDWTDGGALTPREAATKMVEAYAIRSLVAPSLKSRHCLGLAVDMSVRWTGDFEALDAAGKPVAVVGAPRDATHPTLAAVARTFGVEHFYQPAQDPNHWSDNGH